MRNITGYSNCIKPMYGVSTVFIFLLSFWAMAQNPPAATNRNWTASKPFQRDVFIENKGQFGAEEMKAVGSQICYATIKGKMFLYFTPTGLVMRYDSLYKLPGETEKDDGQEDELKDFRVMHLFTKMQWLGCNPNPEIEVENETPDYFTYRNNADKNGPLSVLAHAWTKLTYKNLYNGIDVEFYYPEKGGIEYSVIVHPGADLSQVKLCYSGSALSMRGNDLVINTGWGEITDHAPTATETGDVPLVSMNFITHGNTVSFVSGSYNKNETLTIDPWITATTLGGSNKAYDLGYDYLGNVYVYGGGVANYYELQKYNSSGILQWTYTNTNFTYVYSGDYFYGGMCTDHITGTSYLCEGYDPSPGILVAKINYNGVLGALYHGNGNFIESWKIGYDYCNNQLVLDLGNISAEAGYLDTNLTNMVNVNVLNQGGPQDQTLLSFDNAGECYIGTCRMVNGGCCPNELCKVPVPSLSPTAWIISDNHTFEEITNISYYPPISPYVAGNGFNGCAATTTFVLTYDGGTMRKWKATNGTLMNTVTVSNTMNAWGGIDIGCDGHVYCGNNNEISIYDSDMNALGSIPLSNTVYALAAAPNGDIYAAGNAFVQSVDGGSKMVTVTSTPAGCTCSGTATAHTCGNGQYSFLWSNGATTSSISNMCSGTYTLAVSALNCAKPSDTAIVDLGAGGGFVSNLDTVQPTCQPIGSASVNPAGNHPPFTYSWSNGATSNSISGLSAGSYSVIIQDSSGCKDTVRFSLTTTGIPVVTVTPAIDSICPGGNITLTAHGAQSYTWTPASGLSCTGCSNPVASPSSQTIYTVVGDSNGCPATATATVSIYTPPTVSITASPDTVCVGKSSQLTASGGVSYTWNPSLSLSCSNCFNPISTPTANISYTVTATDVHGCTATSSITVFVANPPALSVSSGTSICPGQSATLGATGTGTDFHWFPGNIPGPIIQVSPSATTTYTVTLSAGCGLAVGNVTVFVHAAPVPEFSANITSGCYPLCIKFNDLSSIASGNITAWSWLFGNGDSSNTQNPEYCYPGAGNFNVDLSVVSDSGCAASLSKLAYISVYSHPKASFVAEPQPTDILEPTIQFTDQSKDDYGIAYWFWNFNDSRSLSIDQTSTLENPSHTYSDTGTYCPSLTVINVHGCTDTATDCVIINPIFTLYIPDAFTPNGDGKNEVFEAKGDYVKSFEMYIFDRWGMQLFHSTDINVGWNGGINNDATICQQDTYVYQIYATDTQNKVHSYVGEVNLLK